MSNTGSSVATITSGETTSTPNILIKSTGFFSIKAVVSSSKNYKGTETTSNPVDVDTDVADIEFSPSIVSLSPYIYSVYPYKYDESAASVINVNENDNITYSIVAADSTLTSIQTTNVATIDTTGCFLTTNSCGINGTSTFRICAKVDATADLDYSSNTVLSDVLTIKKATPTILQYPQIIITPPLTSSTLVYGQKYTINTQPITVMGIATPNNIVESGVSGASGVSSSGLTYAPLSSTVLSGIYYAEYRLRFSNGIVSNLTIQSKSPQGLTNPDISFALTNVPFQGVTAILQGKSLYPNSDNLWYDVNVPQQFITQDKTTVKFSGSDGTGYFNSTASPFQNSINTLSSNTDIGPSASYTYSSTDNDVAKITVTTVEITGVDSHFQINTAVSSTTNYNEIPPSMSPQTYNTIKATPAINYFPTIPQTLGYGGDTFTIPSTILTSNTDTPGPVISYLTSDSSVAIISGNTITVTGVGQYKINVTIHSTKNFSEYTYTYPTDPSTYYNTKSCIPVIEFDSTFVTSLDYGSTYNLTGVILSNNDPLSQVLTYSIIDLDPVGVATLTYKSGVPNPSITINSVGTFQIQASCPKSSNGFYSSKVEPSQTITVTNEIPIIEFVTSSLTNSTITKSPLVNWTSISVSSNGHYQSAVVNGGGIYTSSDYGSTWIANNSAPANANWYSISLSSTGKYQSAVIYGGYIYISSNYGATWDPTAQGASWNSISISSTGQTQVASINGGQIYYSGDYGATWNWVVITHTGQWYDVSISSTGQYQTAVEYGGSIYTSINTGQSWNEASNTRSYNWNSVSISSDTGKYQSAVQNPGTIYTSSDYGSTWNPVTSTSGAPVSSWVSISISSTGKYQLAGTNNGTIYTSSNYGATWNPITNIISENMPIPLGNWNGISLSSTGQYQTACLASGNIYFSSNYGATWDTDASVSYIYRTTPYNFTPSNPIATITNNTVQKLKYSIVDIIDGITPSSAVATITEDGTSLTTTGVGSFQILATAVPLGNDYGTASLASEIITVLAATPNITTYPILPSTFVYGKTYGIPTNIATDNTDIPGPTITYSPSNQGVATIYGNQWYGDNSPINTIYGLYIYTISVNIFQINVTIGATNNYKSRQITLPSQTTYYTSIPATPTITFPPNFGIGWNINGKYDLTSSVTTNTAGSYTDPAIVNYSIFDTNSNSNVKMVTVGSSNSIVYSYDGINWINSYTNNMSSLFSVAYNGRIWLAGGLYGSCITYSLNGINWFSSVNSSSVFQGVYAIATSGSMWVAAGYGTIAYSYDGIFWQIDPNSQNLFTMVNGIAYNGSRWVAVGSGAYNSIAYSDNGINWYYSNNSQSIFQYWGYDVAWNGSTMWVAVGYGTNSIAYSYDGLNWNPCNTFPGYGNTVNNLFTTYGHAIAWNGSMWVAVGWGTNSIAYSNDGINWIASNNTQSIIYYIVDIAWSNTLSLWFAVGYNGSSNPTIVYSSDGINWNGNSLYSSFPNNGQPASIASTTLVNNTITLPQSRIVALGNCNSSSNAIIYSDDGMNWTPANGIVNGSTGSSQNIFSLGGMGVAWNGSMWVAVGYGTNTIAYSINGILWYPSNYSTNIFSLGGRAVAWNGSMWVAVGEGISNTVAYSYDGLNWTGCGMVTGIGNSVAWNGLKWILVGQNGNRIAESSDGKSWFIRAPDQILSIGYSVAWNGSIWVVVGSSTYNNTSIIWSSDGINWTGGNNASGGNSGTIFSTSGRAVAWNGAMWVAVGEGANNTIAYSFDGKNWTGIGNSIFTSYGISVTWHGALSMWVATGVNINLAGVNNIVYSNDGINWYPVNNASTVLSGTGTYGMGIGSSSSVIYYKNAGSNTSNIATIDTSSSQVLINSVGTFQIQANMPGTDNFLPALTVISAPITIGKLSVYLKSTNFNGFVYMGGQYTLSVTTSNTDNNGPIITYSIDPKYGVISGNILTVGAAGNSIIYVNISGTTNFGSASIPVGVTIAQAMPLVLVNNDNWIVPVFTNFNQGTPDQYIGYIYSSPLIGSNSNPNPQYSYYSSDNNIAQVVSAGGQNYAIRPMSPGSFYISIYVSSTDNNYVNIWVNTRTIYVSAVPEIIIFNNPRGWPYFDASQSEPGMIIGFPYQAYPYGFGNYSVVQIVNSGLNNVTLQIDDNSTPYSFQALCSNGRYQVLFNSPYSGWQPNQSLNADYALSNNNSSLPNNIGNVLSSNSVAWVYPGYPLTFYFTGLMYGQGPSSLAITVNLNPVNAGQIGVYHPTIGPSTFPFYASYNVPTGIIVNNGYYIASWSGYGIFNLSQYNWVGYWTFNYNYLPYYPSGSSVNQAWGINGTTVSYYTYDSNSNQYYYQGIPKILYPYYYN
jgi:hypothetical protein